MKANPSCLAAVAAVALSLLALPPDSFAQPAAPTATAPTGGAGQGRSRPPRPAPVEVSADGHITFRILAPNAQSVRVNAGDIPGTGGGIVLTQNTNGVWEGTVGPVQAGEYRYNFNVDGLSVIAPRNPATPDTATTSESNDTIWSLVNVPGSDLMDTRNVPHGAVETVTYFSKALNRFRRMHVYTPPGYDEGSGRYPVFYLLHGSGDSDDAWSTVGRAGFIMDNLIADGKAQPMVVVMPAGHTAQRGPRGAAAAGTPRRDEFQEDFSGDIMPYVETHYRVYSDQGHRAIAGLSMGGGQTLTAAFATLDQFAYIGVFSSGAGIGSGGRGGPSWEERHKDVLDNPDLKKGIKLIWFGTGKADGLMPNSRATVEMLKKHGFDPVFIESPGAHTWINWRDYLGQFAPQLFR
jgi:enterochelin esterase-like enzyme